MKKHKNWMKKIEKVKANPNFGPLQEFKNEEGRYHRDDAPAYISPTTLISYQDGRKHGVCMDIWGSETYFYEDVMIPPSYMLHPEKLKFEDLLKHPNSEVRAVGLKIYGFERMLNEDLLTVVEIEKDTNYMLLKWEADNLEESFGLVRVFNGTVNADGTRDIYYLIVPPNMRNVREAVAWTFYKEPDEYSPVVET
jgi:hypothetical protein